MNVKMKMQGRCHSISPGVGGINFAGDTRQIRQIIRHLEHTYGSSRRSTRHFRIIFEAIVFTGMIRGYVSVKMGIYIKKNVQGTY